MYFIWDLYEDTYIRCRTERDLVLQWTRLNGGRDFGQLNMTGNDCYASKEFTGTYTVLEDGTYVRDVCTRYYTRRYLVTDDRNRTVDLRLFPDELWDIPEPRRRWYTFNTGRRRRWHRQNGPSMYRRQMRDAQAAPDLDGLDEDIRIEARLLRNVSVRTKTVIDETDAADKYDRRAAHGYYAPRCWKDQTKTRKQYQRHDRRRTRKNAYRGKQAA